MSVVLGLEHLRHLVDVFFFHHLPTLAIIRSRVLNKKKILWRAEVVTRGCSVKKMFVKISPNAQEKPMSESLFNKVACLQAVTLSKRDSGTSVFLGNLQNFPEQLFSRTPLNSCFCKSSGHPTAVKYFRRKIHHRYPTGFWIRL